MKNPDTDQLLQRAAAGDNSAAQELLTHYRPRLRRMVATYLDRRISARTDPSDVVQEALTEAFKRLPQYAKDQTISFYPWLRQIAWQRLLKLHRTHLTAARRSVHREDDLGIPLSDDSVLELARQLASNGTDPGKKLLKKELRERVRAALEELRQPDRSVLVMRYLEHMSLQEIGETMELSSGAVKMRHARALERLQRVLSDDS